MTTVFLKGIKTNESIKELMKAKGLKATKTEKQQGKNKELEFFIGDFLVSKLLVGPKGGVKAQVNCDVVQLMTYMHKQ